MTRNAGINLPGTDPSRGRQGRWLWIVLGVALVVGATALALGRHEGPSPARAPSPTCSGAFDLGPDVGGLSLPYCANRSLTATDAGVRRLVVVIHGDARNADDYLADVQDAADLAGAHDVLIVAPWFQTADDAGAKSNDTAAYWSDNGWKQGDPSESRPLRRPGSISSFAALDRLVASILTSSAFPNVATVVIAGHSAGGQFVDRYVATSAVPSAAATIAFEFVVANPSSYLYFDARRYDPDTGAFAEPGSHARADCPDFNAYKYGLESLNPYAAIAGATTMRTRAAERHVTELLGANDIDPHDSSLDKSCAGEWQGPDRLDRGRLHMEHLASVFGADVLQTHVQHVIPGVAHDGRAMFLSAEGRAALFGLPR